MDQQPTNTPNAAPEPVGPFTLPSDLTPEQAAERLAELRTDRDWQKKWFSGDRRAMNEFDRLTERAVQPATPAVLAKESAPEAAHRRLQELKSDPSWGRRILNGNPDALKEFDRLVREAAPAREAKFTDAELQAVGLGAPPFPEDYKLDLRDPTTGRVLQLDEENHALVHGTLLPAAHELNLSQADVTLIADYILRPMDEDRCERALKAVWGSGFKAGLDDFRKAMQLAPARTRELLEAHPETLGNNPALIASIVAQYRARQARR